MLAETHTLSAKEVLERCFLENRAMLLEIASFLDVPKNAIDLFEQFFIYRRIGAPVHAPKRCFVPFEILHSVSSTFWPAALRIPAAVEVSVFSRHQLSLYFYCPLGQNLFFRRRCLPAMLRFFWSKRPRQCGPLRR